GNNGQGLLRVGTFDVREINLDDFDSATVVFDVTTNGFPPTLLAFDPVTHQAFQVVTSRFAATPQTPVLIGLHRLRLTVTFDATSVPALSQLRGTLFTFVVPRVEPEEQRTPPTPVLLASNGPAAFDLARAPQQEIRLERSGFSGGSETLLATAPSHATPLDPGPGGDVDRAD